MVRTGPEVGGDRSRHLHGRGDGAVVVGGGDDNAAGAGKGGGEKMLFGHHDTHNAGKSDAESDEKGGD